MNTIMLKTLLSTIFSFTILFCSAQNKLLTYQDLQYIIQNNPALVNDFLQQKDYHLQPGSSNTETHFFELYADTDYTDILIALNKRRTIIRLSTTHLPQVEMIQKALAAYPFKNNKDAKIYRIKDGTISTIAMKEDGQQVNGTKLYTFEVEN
ncbi:hypothetical protein [Mucilaginibacter arboris]|nr:hypothetical protein [Mucilaginibacter arboris]